MKIYSFVNQIQDDQLVEVRASSWTEKKKAGAVKRDGLMVWMEISNVYVEDGAIVIEVF